jgi:hypothetical protein
MIYEENIIELLKDPLFKNALDVKNYYLLKCLFDKEFQKKSRIFSKELIKYVDNSANQSLFPSLHSFSFSRVLKNVSNDINESLFSSKNFTNNNIELEEEEDVEKLINCLLEDNDISLLEQNEDYIIYRLINYFIHSEEYPHNSNLFLTYNLFCTEIELIFCLKLAQKLPKYKYIPNFNEIDILKYHHKNIQEKISSFLSLLEETKKESRIKNVLLESLFETEESTSLAEIASSLIQDPLLPNKLLSQKKLLIEGIFYFEIEEITRQLSLIDHENLRRLVRNGYKNLFKEGENSSYILSIILREKQFNCYILLTILNQSTLENIKIIIQKYISLAHNCRRVRNYQSCFNVILCFHKIKLKDKKMIWNLIEKGYKEYYISLETEFLDVYMKEFSIEASKGGNFIPNIHGISSLMNRFLRRSKVNDINSILSLSNDYREFIICLKEAVNNKPHFFKVNPLYIFLKYGYLEVFVPRAWNLSLKMDFSHLGKIDVNEKFSRILTTLMEKFDKSFL